MRTIWLGSTIIALLLGGPLHVAIADGSLDTRVNFGDPLQNRLVVGVPRILFIREARIIVWTQWVDKWPANDPVYRVATDMPGFALGPLSLTGGLRELGNPHPTSARGSAWRETTGARLDAGIDPVARRGLSLSPEFLPVSGFVIQTDDGLAAGTSIGSWFADGVRRGRSWGEFTVAASRPADGLTDESPNGDPAEIGWFERVPMPADMLHLLCRGRFPVGLPGSVVDVGPAVGVSLSEAFPPGWWWRLAISAELSLTPTRIMPRRDLPGHYELGLEVAAFSSVSSARYRLSFAEIPAEGTVVGLAVCADLHGHAGVTAAGVSAAGRFATAWRPEATVPGVAFTLLGLESDDVELDVGTYVTLGRWRFDLATGLDAEWHEVTDADGMEPVRAATVATELLMGIEYKVPRDQVPVSRVFPLSLMLLRRSCASLKISLDDDLQIDSTGELQLGPVTSGSDGLFGLSGTISFADDDGSWGLRGATAECRTLFDSGSAVYRADVGVEWDRDSDDPITWNVELGWTVARGEE